MPGPAALKDERLDAAARNLLKVKREEKKE